MEPDTCTAHPFSRPAYCLRCGDAWQEEGYVGFRAYESCPKCINPLLAFVWYVRHWLYKIFHT